MGKRWDQMDARPRKSISDLAKHDIPATPGVYAIYRDGARIYVGKAGHLQNRIWKAHCGRSKALSNSAFRRNVAESLRIARAAEIKSRAYQLTPTELDDVRSFVESCEIAWITCATEPDAAALETAIKEESRPPLTKI